MKKSFIITILISALLSNDNSSFFRYSDAPLNRSELKGLIGIMVDFKEDNNPLTSGNGKFLDSLNVGFIQDNNIQRCNIEDHFIVDPPPHNKEFFESQLKAVKNYYFNISNGSIEFGIDVIDSVYTAIDANGEYQEMQFFSQSEDDITTLYKVAVELAQDQIINIANDNNWTSSEDFLVVVFHAGLGQDLGTPYGVFDPTIYDIHSAYIDSEMLSSIGQETGVFIESGDTGFSITNGILMPETLNQIYFDVIEDLYAPSFVNEEDLENLYCDYQLGMTGLMSYFLGYRLGFPVMHSTNNISPVTRIGEFGLMDVGAYNGRGVIPAPPTAWSRIFKNISNIEDITFDLFSNLSMTFEIGTFQNNGDIYKIDVFDDEYFLIENRSNKVNSNLLGSLSDYSISDINFLLDCDADNNPYCNGDEQLELKEILFPDNLNESQYYWFDILERLFDCDTCEFVDSNGVIINFPDYDYGLPGSGLLIWHIQEPSNLSGMNNDLTNKAVHLEEGDGMINIGYDDPNPFGSCLDTGCKNDFWFPSNSVYQDINNSDDIVFNSSSIPSSDSYSGVSSNISIEINRIVNNNINFTVSYDSDYISIIDENFTRYLGNDGTGIYYLDDGNLIWYNDLFDIKQHVTENEFCNSSECIGCVDFNNFDIIDDEILVYDDKVCIAPEPNCVFNGSELFCNPSQVNNKQGYFSKSNLINDNYAFCLDCDAIGDIDLDGIDEYIKSGQLFKQNDLNLSDVSVSGFSNNFDDKRYYLVSDLIGVNPDFPEIISFPNGSGSTIDIISYNGQILDQFQSSGDSLKPCIISNENNDVTFIVHGNRTIRFEKYNANGHYWHNVQGDAYNSGIVGVSREFRLQNFQNWEDLKELETFDFNEAFNYPNPFDDSTVFRFYASDINSLTIKIYTIAGFLKDEIKLESIIHNQYNEYTYNTSSLKPGLYIAELKSDNQSKIIKLLKTK